LKVIHELVAYFDRRGLLAQAHLTRLLDQGLLAHEAPRTMVEHCGHPGQSFYFRVTGETEGAVWGTDLYTGDSAVACAAVHAGFVKAGDTIVLRVVVAEPPARFEGSPRNGVTSHDFEHYGTAFRFERVGPAA
jgi:hypothetical protein